MKTDTSFQTPFLFNPEMSFANDWSNARPARTRPRALGLAMETQIDYKQELVCGVIMIFCLLFGLAAFVVQFAA